MYYQETAVMSDESSVKQALAYFFRYHRYPEEDLAADYQAEWCKDRNGIREAP
ncbi:hypothetical protein CFSAN001921_24565 (plasmid) [Salmonella enterica subsp. enterica serovar Typhimurium var. 5- str. CFSAN001921]|nr:hypothetical protein [Salmonella enterica]AGQ71205.1 hypothetical protein CFSAN001921_24565 [Salmonella enterica subsp. enterica serovar Typhimurium var. 5- str. CFSAN001921]WDM56201.1 hypothetical protein K0025_00915 [Salmonella enterica subsp. enterica serovar Heidelberg]